ncbi:MAG TPA: 2-phosphosulfolactate phosphatase [Dehalococcoidia bacterium]|jgi:2-phosphosulfolactate phosphatase|nr:2-phosphosulfolactate phosphatase [Dehalococcoidia bacterium]
MTSRIDVALRPKDARELGAECFVVIDLFLATTTIATLFSRGMEKLTVTASVEEARRIAERDGAILLGEAGGLPPEGFDYGNSPVEVKDVDFAGKEGVFVSTNGSVAICAVADIGPVVVGGVININAIVDEFSRYDHAAVVCAGGAAGERLSFDDLGGAGAVVTRMREQFPGIAVGDAARLASIAWKDGGPGMLKATELAAFARSIGLEEDLDFSLQPSTVSALPRVTVAGEGWAELR